MHFSNREISFFWGGGGGGGGGGEGREGKGREGGRAGMKSVVYHDIEVWISSLVNIV